MSDGYLEYMDSSFLFAYKDQLFMINSDGCVIEIDDYVAIGSGAQEAIGSLLSTEGQGARRRIVKAIKASAANDIYVDYPIILADTSNTEFEIVTEKNENKYLIKDNQGEKNNESIRIHLPGAMLSSPRNHCRQIWMV